MVTGHFLGSFPGRRRRGDALPASDPDEELGNAAAIASLVRGEESPRPREPTRELLADPAPPDEYPLSKSWAALIRGGKLSPSTGSETEENVDSPPRPSGPRAAPRPLEPPGEEEPDWEPVSKSPPAPTASAAAFSKMRRLNTSSGTGSDGRCARRRSTGLPVPSCGLDDAGSPLLLLACA